MGRARILLFAAFWSVHCVTSALTNTSDQSALLVLKSHISFSSNNVFLEKNWSAASSVCSWIGVTCGSRHSRVTSLDISNMGLTGSIPADLGNLSFLSYLDLSNNSFSGNLPGQLALLRRLKLLDLRRNNFSGKIPPSVFSSLPELQFLHLSRNSFSGSIPASLSNLTKIEELALNRNFLQGSIPEEIGDLHSLTFLNLEGNQFTGPIPPHVFNLSLLENLALSGNDLSGDLPVDFCYNLPKLEGLYLSSNELEGLIPPSIGKCSQLQVLSLSRNEFSGTIPREIGNLTLLTLLHLGGNNLEGTIPTEIGNLQRLEVFGLDGDSLSGSIPASVFNISTLQDFTCVANSLSGNLPSDMGKKVPNLETLHFGMNNLSGNIPVSISNASKLTILDLSNNIFSGPIPNALGNLGSLNLLSLGGNNLMIESSSSELVFLTSLTKCRNLTELVIGENPLNGTLPASIGNFSTSLQIFDSSGCNIRGTIPDQIGNLTRVSLLSLSDNNLIGTIPSTIDGLQSLQQLYLDNNKITGSVPDNICSLQKLGAIGLRGNQISGAVPSCIGNISSLRHLTLASNSFSSSLPPRLWRLKDLLRFDASSNSLSGFLPPEIGNLKAVIEIDLSSNNFSGNIPQSIGVLQNLINLSLAQNNLEGPIPNTLGKVVSLEGLDLSHNKLTGMIPQSLEDLKYLRQFNVSFNQLSGQIPTGGPFQNFTNQSFLSNGALCGAPQFQVLPCPMISPHRRRKRFFSIIYIILGISSLILVSALGFLIARWQKKKEKAVETDPSPATAHQRISYYELEKITDGFSESNLLGIGGYSSVYKGTLPDGTPVAVKVFNMKLAGALKTFDTECEVVRNIRHRNLTKVITSCSNQDMDFKALVLEYMPNGSLEKWLYSHNYFLDIFQRLDIMIDVASALDYLHNGYSTSVVHCDVKPSNVLLDEDMVGHVCDFGIAKLLGAEDGITRTKTIATIGYIAPEHGLEGLVSTKCDVYSYGIMLMETFTRVKPSDDMFAGAITLRQWIIDSFPSGLLQVLDSNMLKPEEENFDAKMRSVSSLMELALDCTETSPNARKNMQDVLSTLKRIRMQLQSSHGNYVVK
ncbi:probable LRR receptor-like serine/threonine-protein kinase At3g47570 [Coffea eugenioides]|uniref:probable LRR receptor-like serine/threonine-protein kinase At3g47570 n=1 Tax=Coffea eugenioides TaxID=49369 RepID=UPI000F60675E|nr:probable LRR receptor-like serine/threonine-protein kinase At3g47570 [Coffea eugenioides]